MRREREESPKGIRGRTAGLALLVWMGLSLSLKDPGKGQAVLNLIASFARFDLARLLMLPGLYFLFRKAAGFRSPEPRRWARLIPACFFALNMVLGEAFYREGNWNALLSPAGGQLLRTAAVWASWSTVFERLLRIVFAARENGRLSAWLREAPPRGTVSAPGGEQGVPDAREKGFHPLRRYQRLLRAHPFATPFFTLMILYLPHFLISYPALFMGDTWCMIVQGYSELGMTGVDYLSPDRVLRSGVYINQHHPVLYTLLLQLFLRTGDALFHSLNAGIFLLCLAQAAAILAALAYAVSTLLSRQVPAKTLMLLILYVWLQPQVRNFLFLATKDGLYCAAFVLLMSVWFRGRTGETERKERILLGLAAAGMILLRNEGRYVLTASFLLMAWADARDRKKLLCLAGGTVLFSLAVFQGLYPALGYTRGGVQEALSVPLQQTARVVREHAEELTAEERAAIDAVLEYDRLAENYNPDSADEVKGLYRQEATGEELAAWLRTWAGLVTRFPDSCLQAFYGNYYQYLYPGDFRMSYYTYGWSAWMCEMANERMAGLGKGFSLPKWNERLRYICDSLTDAGLFHVPPFSLMMTPALYSWALIALAFGIAGRRKDAARSGCLALLTPSLLSFLVLFAGPTNGFYSRYMLPLTSFLPFLWIMTETVRRREEENRGEAAGLREPGENGMREQANREARETSWKKTRRIRREFR